MDHNGFTDEKAESRVYVGNLDLRITEATLIKMFSPYGTIISEDFLWHTRGPKRGEPRGFAFVQFSSKEEARLAKEKMHGRLACGRPLVVRVSSEQNSNNDQSAPQGCSRTAGSETKKPGGRHLLGSLRTVGQKQKTTSKSAKIAAIKNKLRALEEETTSGSVVKRQKTG